MAKKTKRTAKPRKAPPKPKTPPEPANPPPQNRILVLGVERRKKRGRGDDGSVGEL